VHPVWVIKRRCSMQEGPTIRIDLVAEIAEYEVVIVGDRVTVAYRDEERAGQVVTTQEILYLARFVARARELRVALAQVPDLEVVYLFDLAQDGYGYAVNLQVPPFSEWGTAPVELWRGRLGSRDEPFAAAAVTPTDIRDYGITARIGPFVNPFQNAPMRISLPSDRWQLVTISSSRNAAQGSGRRRSLGTPQMPSRVDLMHPIEPTGEMWCRLSPQSLSLKVLATSTEILQE
jgi:hypothetical protein